MYRVLLLGVLPVSDERKVGMRKIVYAGLAVVVLAVAAEAGFARAQPLEAQRFEASHAVKVGFLLPLTGVFSPNAEAEQRGWKLGLEDFAASLHGRSIQTYYADTQGDPTIALTGARELVDQKHVDMIEGPLLASAVSAVGGYLGPHGVPTDDLAVCSGALLDSYAKYGNAFTLGWTCDQPTLAAIRYIKSMHYHHITIVAMDYSWGWNVVGAFMKDWAQQGKNVIDKVIWYPLTATDFAPYVSNIPKSTQAVYVVGTGTGAIRFTQAYHDFGYKGKIPLIGVTTLTDYSVLPQESPAAVLGVKIGSQYCDGIDTPQNRRFTAEFHKAYHTYPGYYAEEGYTKAELLIKALGKLGPTFTAKQLVHALKTTPVVAPRGPVSLTPQTNTPTQNIYICKVEKVKGVLRNIPIKVYKNVKPWGWTSAQTWRAHFDQYTKSQPST